MRGKTKGRFRKPQPQGTADRISVGTLPARTVRISEAVLLRHPPEQVWELIFPAEHAPVLSPNIVRGFAVPGTPTVGVGHQQCFTDVAGNTSILEVIEHEAGRRAVTRTISPRPAVPHRMVHLVDPAPNGTVLSLGIEIDVPAGQQIDPGFEPLQRRGLRDYLDRAQRALAMAETTRTTNRGRHARLDD
ncbi:SRPBCC family protein [Rhodococcus sp. X156]|uniref:SRPBCC family protein n=1 Tax=Rhodococcus sp. X156 TaxID=2499145 RepID=UPI000FD70A6A|nr:SRPBCC family protein [Rhodococcus sp. X156]